MSDVAAPSEALKLNAFTTYGLMMAQVGAFEQILRVLLGMHELRKAGRATRAHDPARIRRLSQLDFKQLAGQTAAKFKFDDTLKGSLGVCVDIRNELAHIFWPAHFGHLRTERGVNAILWQLQAYKLNFERVSEQVIKGTGFDVSDYIAFVHNQGLAESGLDDLERSIGMALEALANEERAAASAYI